MAFGPTPDPRRIIEAVQQAAQRAHQPSWPPSPGQYPVDTFQGPHSPNDEAWLQYREAQQHYAQKLADEQRRLGVKPEVDLRNVATGRVAQPAGGGMQFFNNPWSRQGPSENYYLMTPEQRRRDEAATAGRKQYLESFGIEPGNFTDGTKGFTSLEQPRAGVPSQMMSPEEADFRRSIIDSMQSKQRYQTQERLPGPGYGISHDYRVDRRQRGR